MKPCVRANKLLASGITACYSFLKSSNKGARYSNSSFLLTFLYTLQYIPFGLSAVIPLVVQGQPGDADFKGYSQVALYSLVAWPTCLKLLWAPIVDSVYSSRRGRRKSWLVPCELLTAAVLYASAAILGSRPLELTQLTIVFLLLNLFFATHGIALDGLAVSVLPRGDIGMCNLVGHMLGAFLGGLGFLSARSSGLLELDGFMHCLGGVFAITAVLLTMLYDEGGTEQFEALEPSRPRGLLPLYSQLLTIFTERRIQLMGLLLLTVSVPFAPTQSVIDLRYLYAGVPVDKFATRGLLLLPLPLILPWLKGVTPSRDPMTAFRRVYPYRLAAGLLSAALLSLSSTFRNANGDFTPTFYALWIGAEWLQSAFNYALLLPLMALMAQVAQVKPALGGTYMSVMNALAQIGYQWPVPVVLYAIDGIDSNASRLGLPLMDGFFTITAMCTAIGVLWYWLILPRIFQQMDSE